MQCSMFTFLTAVRRRNAPLLAHLFSYEEFGLRCPSNMELQIIYDRMNEKSKANSACLKLFVCCVLGSQFVFLRHVPHAGTSYQGG